MRRRRGRMRMKRIRLYKSVDYSEYARRTEALFELGFTDYKQYCRSKLWKSIRSAQLEKYPMCYGCVIRPANQVHHAHYSLEILSGLTSDGLWSLCARCHRGCEFSRQGKFKLSPQQATNQMHTMRNLSLRQLARLKPEFL